ncbi:GNAT family N-acetyltransferase [Microbacterium sp.]|uniref:GNAT family N-acetyltransferase n=1 Tax=Microbacterium sp. TaxID=51671 RepID=UPI0039E5786F
MTGTPLVRTPVPADAAGMARVHVASWRETYRGLMRDDLLDAPDFEERQVRFWTAALTEPRYRDRRFAVAELAGDIVGIALSGPRLGADDAELPGLQLYILYLLRAHHGTGAGGLLLDAVVPPGAAALLWVADPNPRAQAFYRRNGFVADGAEQEEFGIREIRMVRAAEPRQHVPNAG